jgi:hypothetical protein
MDATTNHGPLLAWAETATSAEVFNAQRRIEAESRVARLESERYRGELSGGPVALGAIARRKSIEEGEARARRHRDAFKRAARSLLPADVFQAVESEARVLEKAP